MNTLLPSHRRHPLALVIVLSIAGCSSPSTESRPDLPAVAQVAQVPPPADTGASATVRLDLREVAWRSPNLVVTGSTDLPAGALIAYQVTEEDLAAIPAKMAEGTWTVAEGGFGGSVSLSGWPPGAVELWVGFQTILGDAEQPADVIAKFGKSGERMTGANVTTVGRAGFQMKRVETTRRVAR